MLCQLFLDPVLVLPEFLYTNYGSYLLSLCFRVKSRKLWRNRIMSKDEYLITDAPLKALTVFARRERKRCSLTGRDIYSAVPTCRTGRLSMRRDGLKMEQTAKQKEDA